MFAILYSLSNRHFHILYKSIYLFSILIFAFTGCNAPHKTKTKEHLYLQKIDSLENFLATHKMENSEGYYWLATPDSLNSAIDMSLYTGVPGIVLFYLEYYQTTGDSLFLNMAINGGEYIITHIPADNPDKYNVGLYTGLAGQAYTLLELYNTTGHSHYLKALQHIVNILNASAERTHSGLHWGKINDVVYGSAGIGLFLLDYAKYIRNSKADSINISIANELVASAEKTENGIRWNMMPQMEYYMDNFSHGTAGVAYYLTQMYISTQNEKYLQGALSAADYLLTAEDKRGWVCHHSPGGEDLYYMSWCHGPAGTSRLYYALWEATGDQSWVRRITKPAYAMLNLDLATDRYDGLWYNFGRCCGDAGIAEYYLWIYRLTSDQRFLDASYMLTQRILENATVEKNAYKWVHAENRVSPDDRMAQSGLMQGSAGIGLWLLELVAFERGKLPMIHFPDKP